VRSNNIYVTSVVFDVGGVLLDWNPRHLYRKLFADETSMEHFLAEICTPAWHEAHDRGLPTAPSCAELARAHPEYAEEIMAWAERSEEMVAGEIPGTASILDQLRAAGCPCYGLTNMEAETFPLRLKRFACLQHLDGIVVSGFERVAKPDPEIYLRLLNRYGIEARDTLMVDDDARNVKAARALGMRAVRFSSAASLRTSLEDLGLIQTQHACSSRPTGVAEPSGSSANRPG
jgi:2-haloacid dehalogenase